MPMELNEEHIPGVTVHPYEQMLAPYLDAKVRVSGPVYVDRTLYGYGPVKSLTGEDDYGYVYVTAGGKYSVGAKQYVGNDYDADKEDAEYMGAESLQVAWANINRDDELEPDVTECGSGEERTSRTAPTFPVLTGVRFLYNGSDKAQECIKCGARMFWGGFAGDEKDWIVAGMVHWYAHKRDARSK